MNIHMLHIYKSLDPIKDLRTVKDYVFMYTNICNNQIKYIYMLHIHKFGSKDDLIFACEGSDSHVSE
jgi:hypothetical protein